MGRLWIDYGLDYDAVIDTERTDFAADGASEVRCPFLAAAITIDRPEMSSLPEVSISMLFNF